MAESQPKKVNPLENYYRQPKLYIKLPSKGRFYPEDSLDKSEIDEYAVYAMTAKDELMMKTPDALMNGQATVEVIKSCIPSLRNPWHMPSIDIDATLVAIRIATYGEDMEFTSTCPKCSNFNDLIFNLLTYLTNVSNFQFETEITVAPLTIFIRPYNYKELTKNAIKTLEQQKIISIVNDESLSDEDKVQQFGQSFIKLTEMTVDVVAGCVEKIETPEGTVTDSEMIRDFINNTSKETFNAINNRIVDMKEQISLKSQHTKCQECGHEYDIDITMDQSNFFAVGS